MRAGSVVREPIAATLGRVTGPPSGTIVPGSALALHGWNPGRTKHRFRV